MAKEIERKFLVKNTSFVDLAEMAVDIRQAYLSRNPDATVRIRMYGDKAFLTVKGRTHGATRDEWEYPVPVEDAAAMIERLADGIVIDKTRYIVPYAGMRWEVDMFHGAHDGLILAELELETECQSVDMPPFVGDEVTGDPRYYNSHLAGESGKSAPE